MQEALAEKSGRFVEIRDDMQHSLSLLFSNIRIKWAAANRTQVTFFRNNEEWLNGLIYFPIVSSTECATSAPKKEDKKSGRPSQTFMSSSERSKRRKTKELRDSLSSEELAYATQMSLRSSGKVHAAQVVRNAILTSPTRASKYISAYKSENEKTLSADEALSVMVENKFSKQTYQRIRNIAKENKCKLYPSYNNVVKAKKHCYPPHSSITITESSAAVKLQALLNHTVDRILFLQRDVIATLTPDNVRNLKLYCKWGCDGSSGQSLYKQKFTEDGQSDESVFFTSLVPLQLTDVNETVIVWKNPRPSSPRFCRPIRLQFMQENVESTVEVVNDTNEQIELLVPFTTQMHGMSISVKFNMAFTMIDGKVCNAVSGTTSSQRCFLCGATSKYFNDIDYVLTKKVNEKNLQFGMSTLHAWIRFFECCLHLSYKLGIKKWQARTVEEKNLTEERKLVIQKGFRLQLGLVVDRPKPGYGSSNDGNTARRFFEHSTTSATITGVDESLIHRFHVILQALSSGYNINSDNFREYSLETARKFVDLYPWYYMPTSIHKLLIHGPEIIAYALLPIGQLSEEAQEARNKDIKRFREGFSRKCSREATMQDVFNRLLITSDPYISSVRKLQQKPLKSLAREAIDLLVPPEIPAASSENFYDSESKTSTDTSTDTESLNISESEDERDFCF